MQVKVQKFTRTTFPRRSSRRSGGVLSHCGAAATVPNGADHMGPSAGCAAELVFTTGSLPIQTDAAAATSAAPAADAAPFMEGIIILLPIGLLSPPCPTGALVLSRSRDGQRRAQLGAPSLSIAR